MKELVATPQKTLGLDRVNDLLLQLASSMIRREANMKLDKDYS